MEEQALKGKNEKLFWDMCMKFAPDIYLLNMVLSETKIDPRILIPVIKMLGNMDMGNGFGAVNIIMRDHSVTMIKGEESIVVNTKVSL